MASELSTPRPTTGNGATNPDQLARQLSSAQRLCPAFAEFAASFEPLHRTADRLAQLAQKLAQLGTPLAVVSLLPGPTAGQLGTGAPGGAPTLTAQLAPGAGVLRPPAQPTANVALVLELSGSLVKQVQRWAEAVAPNSPALGAAVPLRPNVAAPQATFVLEVLVGLGATGATLKQRPIVPPSVAPAPASGARPLPAAGGPSAAPSKFASAAQSSFGSALYDATVISAFGGTFTVLGAGVLWLKDHLGGPQGSIDGLRRIGSAASGLSKALTQTAGAAWRALAQTAGGAWKAIARLAGGALEAILTVEALEAIAKAAVARVPVVAVIAVVAPGAYELYEHWHAVRKQLAALGHWVSGWAKALGAAMFRAGGALVSNLVEGVRSRLAALGHSLETVGQAVMSYLPHSPAERGPLQALERARVVGTLARPMGPVPALAALRRAGAAVALAAPLLVGPAAAGAASIRAGAAAPGAPVTVAQNNTIHVHIRLSAGARPSPFDAEELAHRMVEALRLRLTELNEQLAEAVGRAQALRARKKLA